MAAGAFDAGTYAVVDAPQAEPPVVGLIASLPRDHLIGEQVEIDYDGHENRWQAGFQYLPEQVCSYSGAADPCAQATNMDTLPSPSLVGVMPFIAWAGDHCSAFGWKAHDFIGRATRALEAAESAIIAHELWTGTQAKASGWPNNYLAGATANVLSTGSTAVSPADALACLEQGIAETSNGQRGVIHCTPHLGAYFSELGNTLRTLDNLIVTYRGTIIVADAGYPGTGPSGAAVSSDHEWAYGTLLPEVRRSQIVVWPDTLQEAFTQSLNFIEYRAERLAAVSFPPCTHVAVQVDVPLCGGGS